MGICQRRCKEGPPAAANLSPQSTGGPRDLAGSDCFRGCTADSPSIAFSPESVMTSIIRFFPAADRRAAAQDRRRCHARARHRVPSEAPGLKRGAKETGDGARAWLFLRHVEAYEAACRAHSVLPALEPVFEPGPFPIRIQTAADLEAARFDLLAWMDPHRAEGPASPFWVQSGMVKAVLEPDAEPLVPLVAADGGAVEGLRLAEGGLVLKIECAGAVVQIRVRGSAPFPGDGGIEVRHRFGLRMPQTVGRMLDFWSVAGLPAPRMGRGGGRYRPDSRFTPFQRSGFYPTFPR